MVQTLAINANGDIFLDTSGNVSLVSGLEAIQNACLTATRAQLGEMVLQTTTGMPTFQSIFNGTPNPAVYENALRNTLNSIDGVVNVVSLSSGILKGVYSYIAEIETIYGNFYLNG